jgi:heterodisulfide reductase subunit B
VHCGVIPPEANLSLNARNLALADNSGYTNIVCTCPTSYANLKECIGELEDVKTRAVINDVLKAVNYEYKEGVTVYHAAEVLYAMKESLAKRATLSLTG